MIIPPDTLKQNTAVAVVAVTFLTLQSDRPSCHYMSSISVFVKDLNHRNITFVDAILSISSAL